MWSLTSQRKRRTSGPGNFQSSAKRDLFNNIGAFNNMLDLHSHRMSIWEIADMLRIRALKHSCLCSVYLCELFCFEFRNSIGFSSSKANVKRAFQSTETAWMTDALDAAETRLESELNLRQSFGEPLKTDKWMANSLLQKSIRRGEVEIAERAALTFLSKEAPRSGVAS